MNWRNWARPPQKDGGEKNEPLSPDLMCFCRAGLSLFSGLRLENAYQPREKSRQLAPSPRCLAGSREQSFPEFFFNPPPQPNPKAAQATIENIALCRSAEPALPEKETLAREKVREHHLLNI